MKQKSAYPLGGRNWTAILLGLYLVIFAMEKRRGGGGMKQLYTPWGEHLDREHPLPEYPRPQLKRNSYVNLNGLWDYKVQDGEEYTKARTGKILVPFAPESLLSGCDFQLQSGETLWYERTFTLPAGFRKDKVLLHFGAVDQTCTVMVNDTEVARHGGGYLPFTLDITEALRPGENRLTVAVNDVTDGGEHAYGKQKYARGGIWYTATSGIWQTVWLESVPDNYVRALRLTPDFDNRKLMWHIDADDTAGARFTVYADGVAVAEDTCGPDGCGESVIPDSAFRPWSPEDPFLYTVTVVLPGGDRVESYFGMRKFSTVERNGHRVFALNNEPYFQSGLLDQGYWSDGLYTPPSDEAMVYDIRTMKDMGFNMLRKHIKVEPLRWYYHCDRLGMLVWQDMPSGGSPFLPLFTQYLPFIGVHIHDAPSRKLGRAEEKGRAQYERDLMEMMDLLYNCVGLCAWVPFNEGWGQFDAKRIADAVKQKDPIRWVDHASGWHDQGGGDVHSYHVYYKPVRMKPDRRVLALTEFGGYSLPVPGHHTTEKNFGYRAYDSAEEWMAAVETLYRTQVIPQIAQSGLSAAVYTQVSDVEDEVNGLLTFDRRVCKMEEQRMAAVNTLLKF